MKNLIIRIWNWFFGKPKEVKKHEPAFHWKKVEILPELTKKFGNGAGFKNNRKRTRGRQIQVIALKNGKTKFIFHSSNNLKYA